MSGNASEQVMSLMAKPMEHAGVRVVRLPDVDRLHERKSGHSRGAFRRLRSRGRVVEGKHFFRAPRVSKTRGENDKTSSVPPGDEVLLTERGYLLLVKAFNDDLSWDVQERLVDVYFRAGDAVKALEGRVRELQGDLHAAALHLDAARRGLASAVLWSKQAPSLAASTLALKRFDKAPGKKQGKRAGTVLHRWREEPALRDASKAAARENPNQMLLEGVSYTVLTDRGETAADLGSLIERMAAAAVAKALANVKASS